VTDHHASRCIGVLTVILSRGSSFDFLLIRGFTGHRTLSGFCDEDEITYFRPSLWLVTDVNPLKTESSLESYVTTDGQSASILE
jgi:hypothetical protein